MAMDFEGIWLGRIVSHLLPCRVGFLDRHDIPGYDNWDMLTAHLSQGLIGWVRSATGFKKDSGPSSL